MLTYPDIDPIAFSLGPLAIRWYGISYLVGFLAAFAWCYHRRQSVVPAWKTEDISDVLFYFALGVIFGGTIGYVLFYDPSRLLQDPLSILKFWEPGRSFHGGLIGVFLALFLYCRIKKRRFWAVADFIAPAIPLGLAAGRIGNFLNAELWGRVTDVPWAMVFPGAGPLPRHPSQLYEFALEGILLFIILAWYSKKTQAVTRVGTLGAGAGAGAGNTVRIARNEGNDGRVASLFLICYGLFRILVECFREPDATQGFILGDFVTMGQLLSIPMILLGPLLPKIWVNRDVK
jgi:phosphatidylglycerol:prolipoprotein diacylglycerol transferase